MGTRRFAAVVVGALAGTAIVVSCSSYGGNSGVPEEVGSDAAAAPDQSGDDATSVLDAGDAGGDADADADADAGDAGCTGLGCPCSDDSTCASGICLRGSFSSHCSKPCCTSSDCANGSTPFICSNGGKGGSYCVDPVDVGNAAPGSKTAGQPCAASTECRSGRCALATGICEDPCCSNAVCPSGLGEICHYTAFDIWECGQPVTDAGLPVGHTCTQKTDCASVECVDLGSGMVCVDPCRSSLGCPSGFVCNFFVDTSTIVNAGCVAATGIGVGGPGSACADGTSCRSGRCDTTHGVCTDVCFDDSDCGGALHCRAFAQAAVGGKPITGLGCAP